MSIVCKLIKAKFIRLNLKKFKRDKLYFQYDHWKLYNQFLAGKNIEQFAFKSALVLHKYYINKMFANYNILVMKVTRRYQLSSYMQYLFCGANLFPIAC